MDLGWNKGSQPRPNPKLQGSLDRDLSVTSLTLSL